jgi:hypothetical protein
MTELAHGVVDGAPIHVGDQVLIRAQVLQSIEGVGVRVHLFSKTDEYTAWIREDHLWMAASQDSLPAEPADGTWLIMHDSEGKSRIFHRDDAEGHFDPDRRHQQHWYDVTGEGWIDWPAAIDRGAATASRRRMVVLAEGQDDLDVAALDDAMHACWLHGNWEWMTRKMGAEAREAAAQAVERHGEHIDRDPERPAPDLRWWNQ